MSALPPIADIRRLGRDVRFVPIADIGLLDHLVGAGEERLRHSDAQRLCRRQVEDEIELGRLLDWQVARLRPP